MVTPNFLFWISITLVKIYISCIIINRGKNIFELVGTVLEIAVLEVIFILDNTGIRRLFADEKEKASWRREFSYLLKITVTPRNSVLKVK